MSDEHDELVHYGILRKSGRYPWGSGANPYQRSKDFQSMVYRLREKGMTDKDIWTGFGMTSTQFRDTIRIAASEVRAALVALAQKLKLKGMSNQAIADRMDLPNESSVRSLLDEDIQARQRVLGTTTNMLRDQVDELGYVDIGSGVENHLGVTRSVLNTATSILKDEDYKVYYVPIKQQSTGHETTLKTLARPDKTFPEVVNDNSLIKTLATYSEDRGETFEKIKPPQSINSDRVLIRYGDKGGSEKDGLIELRRGVEDIDLGTSKYAQVRIAVDDTHFMKGMAVHSDDIPKGYDVVYNTNKSGGVEKSGVFKTMENDPKNPFGSTIKRQKHYVDKNGNEKLSAINILDEEGDWFQWNKTLSSQMLSKQPPSLAEQQLKLSHQIALEEFNEIKSLTNPTVKQELLRAFSDQADSAAVHLKAAGLPGTRQHVLLPVPEMKDTEIYAPNYKNGEKVVLIRHPHGGIFEIPELTVNNRQPVAKEMLGQARDAVAINHKVAEQLSGADFDGDTVLVIPNTGGAVKNSKPLQGLKDFDPQRAYPGFEGMKTMTKNGTQNEMGRATNLVTDMQIQGATKEEIAAAVRHTMVVIDAEKHGLNYKQSEIDNNIKGLRKKYQPEGGVSTLISRASSDERTILSKPRPAKEGGPIDKVTGEKRWVPNEDKSWVNENGEIVYPKRKSTKMAVTSDARTLMSGPNNEGQPIERVYASYANSMKALGNEARKELLSTPNLKQNPTATKTYAPQVARLNAALNVAQMNAPIERQAQILAGELVKSRMEADPTLSNDSLKKVRNQSIEAARERLGAKKQQIEISPQEWEAIQSGAISHSKLEEILKHSDLKQIKELATPRTSIGVPPAKLSRAKSMLSNGYSQAEVAEALGISISAIQEVL